MIRKINKQDDFIALTKVLNEAFASIAKEFGLTKENSPNNNAFISGEELKSQLTENREFYVYEKDGRPVGFIAIEKALNPPGTYYIEKLAVIPEYRHLGIGGYLMDYATNRITELRGKRISIGLIDSNTVLKKWYGKQGYTTFETKDFAHLPFSVCLMDKEI